MKDSQNYILQIDTATPVCSVALSLNGETKQLIEEQGSNIHAEKLTVFIQEILKKESIHFSDLAAISVSKGPGSYTGLRIGVSTAKGLCFGTNLPLIAIDSLQALARGFKQTAQKEISESSILCPVIDARRMEVYQLLIQGQSFQILQPTQAQIVDSETYNAWGEKGYNKIYLFGSGADKFSELFEGHSLVEVVPEFASSAAFMSHDSYEKLKNQDFEDLAYFEPLYLKDFIPTTPKKKL